MSNSKSPPAESLFLHRKDQVLTALDRTLELIDEIYAYRRQQPSFSLDYPQAEGNLAVSFQEEETGFVYLDCRRVSRY